MNKKKEPLYRKHNKLALNYSCERSGNEGGDFRHQRNTKAMKRFEGMHLPMNGKDRGRDYTPLYRFLLSKIGQKWDDVYSEAVSRLDRTEPIFYMVVLDVPKGKYPVVCLGENSYYSLLTVDENGLLVKIDPDARPLKPRCSCCTHSFNGKPYKGGLSWEELHEKYTAI